MSRTRSSSPRSGLMAKMNQISSRFTKTTYGAKEREGTSPFENQASQASLFDSRSCVISFQIVQIPLISSSSTIFLSSQVYHFACQFISSWQSFQGSRSHVDGNLLDATILQSFVCEEKQPAVRTLRRS